MATLRLFIMGYAALVPNVTMDGNNIELVVSLPEATHHAPWLVYERKNLIQIRSLEDDDAELNACTIDQLSLDGKRVGLEGIKEDGEWTPREIANVEASNTFTGVVPTAATLPDFSWVPTMSLLSTTTGAIRKNFLGQGDLGDLKSVVFIDGQIDASVYSVADFEDDEETVIHAMSFKADRDDWLVFGLKQAVADLVLLEIPLQSNNGPVEFTLCSLSDPNDCDDPLTLYPRGRSRSIDVLIGNYMPVVGEATCSQQAGNGHFFSFFDLRERRAQTLKGPYCGEVTVAQWDVEKDYPLPCVVGEVSRLPAVAGAALVPPVVIGGLNRVICGPMLFQPPS